VRLSWLLEFLSVFLGCLSSLDKGATLRESAAIAYKKALAPHHPAPVRLLVRGLLPLVPSKEWFLEKVGEEFESALRNMREFASAADSVLACLKAFLIENNVK